MTDDTDKRFSDPSGQSAYLGANGMAEERSLRSQSDADFDDCYSKASRGDPAAQARLGWRYLHANGTEQSVAKARTCFFEAAKQEEPSAEYGAYFATTYRGGSDLDFQQRFNFLLRAGEHGHADAQHTLSLVYRSGLVGQKNERLLNKDENACLMWLRRSADGGNPDAQVRLGRDYAAGSLGLDESRETAEEWYRKAAKTFACLARNGDVQSALDLSRMYQQGAGVEKNETKALQWLLVAAESGCRSALTLRDLSEMYLKGVGCEPNAVEATKWLVRAAELDDAASQHEAGLVFFRGERVKRDRDEAMRWIAAAAEQGYFYESWDVLQDQLGEGSGPRRRLDARIFVSEVKQKLSNGGDWQGGLRISRL